MLLPCLKHSLPKLLSQAWCGGLHFAFCDMTNLLLPPKLLLEPYYNTGLYVLYQDLFIFTTTSSTDTFGVILCLNLSDIKPIAILLPQFYLVSNLTNLKSRGG